MASYHRATARAGGRQARKDVKIEEGQVVQEKHDIKANRRRDYRTAAALSSRVFSHVARGFAWPCGSVYIVAPRARTSNSAQTEC